MGLRVIIAITRKIRVAVRLLFNRYTCRWYYHVWCMRYIFKLHPDVMLSQICEVTSGTPITIRIRRLRYLPVQGCTRIPVLLDWSRTTTGTLLRKGNLACLYVTDTSVVCDKEFLVSNVLAYTVTNIIRIASYFTHEKCSVYVRIVCMCMYCC